MRRFLPALPVWAAPLFMLVVLLGALALQHLLGWLPCPLCILQRLSGIGLLLALSLAALPLPRNGANAVRLLACLFGAAGLVAGGSHLWLLAQPASGSCGPGLARLVGHLVDALPGSQWLLEGAGACEDVRYQILWIPLPAWSMGAHAAALGMGWLAWRQTRSPECN